MSITYFYCTQCGYSDETLSDLEEYRSGMGCPSCGLGPIRPLVDDGRRPPEDYQAMKTSWYCIVDQQKVIEVITYPVHSGNTPTSIGIRDVALRGQGRGPAMFRPRRLVKPSWREAVLAAKDDLRAYAEECEREITTLKRQASAARKLAYSIRKDQ